MKQLRFFYTVVGNTQTNSVFVPIYGVTARGFLFQREKYNGERSEDDLLNFILSRLKVTVVKVDDEVWERDRGSSSWLLVLCQADDGSCLDTEISLKLAAILVI
jgi:hypothetical protein